MNEKDNGGSAFPCLPPQDTAAGSATGYPFPEAGMTLRDYFAAKALQALVHATQEMTNVTPAMVAEEAYVYADSLLAARGG